jgi:hypothetical protein
MVQVPYLLVECTSGGTVVARAAVSSTWAGVVDNDGSNSVRDESDLLVIRDGATGALNRPRILSIDRQLVTLSKQSDGTAISRGAAPDVLAFLEEAVPGANAFTRAGAGTVTRVTTTAAPVRRKLLVWVTTGATR